MKRLHGTLQHRHFNSCLYTRGDDDEANATASHHYFNSRLYTRGDFLIKLIVRLFLYIFQFTPLHERRPKAAVGNGTVQNISIHASTREATRCKLLCSRNIKFQFTPLHERRPFHIHIIRNILLFQFTPLHERRPEQRRRRLPRK